MARSKSVEVEVVEQDDAESRGGLRTGGLPMYAQLCALFRQRIEAGEWQLNEKIPTLDELVEEFNVARVTVRHALGLLEAEGLLRRYQGRGTFVIAKPESTTWYRIPVSWEELTTTVPDIEFEWLDNLVTEGPQQSFHSSGILAPAYQFLRRRLFRHRIPYGIGSTYIEKSIFDEIGTERFGKPVPLKILNDFISGGISSAEQTVRAGVADLKTAGLLGLSPGAPVMIVARSALDKSGVLVYESFGLFRGDFVEMHTKLV